jgi:hypothetical protein
MPKLFGSSLIFVLSLVSGAARAYPTDFCYERSHFALMVAQDRDKYVDKQSDQDEDYAKKTWAYLLRDQHTDIITTVWEVMPSQAPDAIETVVLQDCLKRPERYR